MAALYAREDVVTTIVTTIPGTTSYSVIPSTVIEATITRTLATVTGTGTDTTGSIDSYTTTTSFGSVDFSLSCSSDGQSSNQCDSLTEATTNFPVEETSYLTYDGTSTSLELTEILSTEVQVAALETEITVSGITTQVTLDSLTTAVTTTISTSVELAIAATTVTIEPTAYTLTVPVDSRSSDSSYSTTSTLESTVITLSVESVSTSISLEKVTTELTQITTLKITIPESTSSFTSSDIVSSYVTTISGTESEESSSSEESSDTNVSSTEESSTTEESTTSEESTTESTPESTTFEESSTSEESTASTSGTASSPTAPAPTSNPTYCEVVRGPLTPEEEVQLQVLFSDRAGASAFADYVVSYASQLVAQIADVANIAVGDNDYAFTTAFNTIDIPGILGLASAAPIYTCFLSSLWAEALSNPQQYAKRAVPTQDEKIKLIVLFEKRENSGMDFDYAELLVDETNDLIAEVQNVSAAAANGDLGAYASLFANVDVPYFLSIATEAPIYTEGLSAALQTALASYSESVFRPTVTTMTTRTYTTVNTIVTNFVNGTVTVPTTIVSTETVVTVEPVGQVQATSTALQAAPAPTANAPVNRVTTEVVTLGNGRVETRTVTICVENCDTVVAESTRRPAAVQTVTTRPNVAVYTQVQNGVTYTHTIEIQTKNAALKKVVALGAGILGGAALLL